MALDGTGSVTPDPAGAEDAEPVLPDPAGSEAAGPVTPDPWAAVVGQPDAVRRLAEAVGSPVPAYLFVGPLGSGKRRAAAVFAGELLAAADPGRAGSHRSRAAREEHPDLAVMDPAGNQLRREEEAEWIVIEASRSPVETDRKVLVVDRFHTATPAAAASLLKTVEEPAGPSIFVLLAEEVPPEHATIASRCTRVDFATVADEAVAAALESEGLDPVAAEMAARAAAGNLSRARILARDDRVAARHQAWRSIPERLDGAGATVAVIVDEVRSLVAEAIEPLAARHSEELAELDRREELLGTRGSGRAHMEARHRREARQFRTEELRFGLATLAARYRPQPGGGRIELARLQAVDRLRRTYQDLTRNPNEALALQALLLDLTPLSPEVPGDDKAHLALA